MRTINFSEARGNLKDVLDAVASDHQITIVTRRDSENAVIMSLSDYNSLQETLYLFGTRANAERLHTAMAEADASLPAGARILGPEGFDASKMGLPTVGLKAAAKEKPATRVIIKGQSSSASELRQAVHVSSRKTAAAAGRVLSEKSKGQTAAKAPVKAKATSTPRRKA